MEEADHRRLSHAWHHDAFCQALAAHVALIHCRQLLEEKKIAIRFENGYGVTIVPVSLKEEVFEVLVLRFYGTGINDYHVAQYAAVPELNRGDFDEILDLCKKVALLPISKARTGSSGPAQAKVCDKIMTRSCSNFL
jgi:hypothetical protein